MDLDLDSSSLDSSDSASSSSAFSSDGVASLSRAFFDQFARVLERLGLDDVTAPQREMVVYATIAVVCAVFASYYALVVMKKSSRSETTRKTATKDKPASGRQAIEAELEKATKKPPRQRKTTSPSPPTSPRRNKSTTTKDDTGKAAGGGVMRRQRIKQVAPVPPPPASTPPSPKKSPKKNQPAASPQKKTSARASTSQKETKPAPEPKKRVRISSPPVRSPSPPPRTPVRRSSAISGSTKVKLEASPTMSLRRLSHKKGFYNETTLVSSAWNGDGTRHDPVRLEF